MTDSALRGDGGGGRSLGLLWLASVRDLQWRRRRFLLAMLGTALVFGIALIGSGMREGFLLEPKNAIEQIGADAWVVQTGANGPFTTISQLDDDDLEAVRDVEGVERASGMINIQDTIELDDATDVYLVAYEPGGVGTPVPDDGRAIEARSEAVASSLLGLDPGESFTFRDREFEVVGEIGTTTVFGGKPMLYVHIDDARELIFKGLPLSTAIVTEGTPTDAPEGLQVMTNDDAEDDLLRPLEDPIGSISLFQVLLWVVAAAIVGLVLYLSALERMRDFAVFKATGTSTLALILSLALQALILSLAAAAVGIVLANVLAPTFPMRVTVPARVAAPLPVIAVVVGLLGSLVGLRRAVTVDPALAFGG
jgi:putative ABC transport system permease protein